jgi:hypothetical protein
VQLFVDGRQPPGVRLFDVNVARDGRLLTFRRIDDDRAQGLRRLLVQNWRAAVAR